MTLLRFLLSLIYPALLTPIYLRWSRDQAEGQIDKMQAAVFNTPGAESPAPPAVIIAGVALLVSHFLVGRTLLRLSGGATLLSLVAGAAVGVLRFSSADDHEP